MQTNLEIGQIVNTFGIKGFVKVAPFVDDILRFDELKKVRVCLEDIIISLIILQVILFRFLNIHEFINKIIV